MVEARFTPVINVPAYFSIGKRQIKRFVLKNNGADLLSVAGWTWQLVIFKNEGNQKNIISLTLGNGLSYEAYSSYTLVADFSAVQTSIEEGQYFWKLIRTDIPEDWISGPAYFSYKAPKISWEASGALNVNIVNESLEVSVVSLSPVSSDTKVIEGDASETVKGIAELATQAESETAADATEGNREHTRIMTARGWRWAWNAIKNIAQTIAAEWTFNDVKLSNQVASAGKKIPMYIDDTGKLVKIPWIEFDTTTQKVTFTGVDDLSTSVLSEWINQSTDLILRLLNDGSVEVGGNTFVIQVNPNVTSGNTRFILNDDQDIGLIFEDSAAKEYISFRTTNGDERINMRVTRRLDTISGIAPMDEGQFTAIANTTASSVTLIGSIPMPNNEEIVHVECNFMALETNGNGGWQKIKATIHRTSAGTVQVFGSTVSDAIQRTAGTFLFSIDADDTNKRINLNFTQNTSGGLAYTLVANAKWTRIVEP